MIVKIIDIRQYQNDYFKGTLMLPNVNNRNFIEDLQKQIDERERKGEITLMFAVPYTLKNECIAEIEKLLHSKLVEI